MSKLKNVCDVNCLVRTNSEKLALTLPELQGAKIILGDTNDLESIVRASEGCDVVIDVHGMRPPRFTKVSDLFRSPEGDATHPYNVNYLGVKRVLAAMKLNNVKKIVRITGIIATKLLHNIVNISLARSFAYWIGSLTGKSPYLIPVILFNFLLSMSPKWHERSGNRSLTILLP